jgi:hypothetical protein
MMAERGMIEIIYTLKRKGRNSIGNELKRFHNTCALSGIDQGGFFLWKKPLSAVVSG